MEILYRTARGRIAAGVFVAAGLLWTVTVAAQELVRPSHGGIELLSEKAYDEALACGEKGPDCAVQPYRLCPDTVHAYEASLATPFSRVASSAAAAKAKGRAINERSWGTANGWGVGIYVSPAPNREADAIQRVVLRKDNRTFEPVTTTVAPWPVREADGSERRLTRGFFAFPIEAFAPISATTVVLIGHAGESSCILTSQRLAALR